MDWNVKNALNRDVERQHLNKILAEIAAAVGALQKKAATNSTPSVDLNIKDTVGEMVQGNTEQGIAVNYDAINKVLNFAVANFTIALQGDVEGSAQVTSLGSVVIDTTLAADVGIADAPFDNSRYWRYNGGWESVNDSLVTFSDLEGEGFPALTSSEGEAVWNLRELVPPAAGITIANPAGVAGDPTFALANDLAAVEGLSTTGLAVRTALDTWATRTITAGGGITVSNGNGVAGNPTIDHADTSSVSNLTSDNSSTTVLQDFTITFDTYGHVQTVTVGTVDLATTFDSYGSATAALVSAMAYTDDVVPSTVLYCDAVNSRIGVGTTSPLFQFHVEGATAGLYLNRTGGSESFIALAMAGTTTGQLRSISGGGLKITNALGTTELVRFDADGRLSGTALHNNAGAVTGTTNQYIASGTYTPTLFNTTNIAASTAFTCQWMRVGNVVTVSGKVDIDPTAASTLTVLGLSLPIASAISASEQLAGTMASANVAALSGACAGDATNDRALLFYTNAADLANRSWYFTFTYVVL